jgi:pyruvate dehydrogenase E2 component (dihydrolipoamide acetyltransferase)
MAVADTSRPARRITISPFALRIAAEQGIDWTKLKGSGTSGRITARDVQLAVAHALTPAVAPTPPADTRLEMSSTRRTIAERMALSARTTAPVTLTTEGDATRLVDLRAALKNAPVSPEQPVPSYGDLLAKIVAQGLIEHPSLNARLEGTEIIQSTSVHMGIAVDTVRGLLVPVLRNAESKGLWQIARESADLIERALAGRISLGELHGGTFTITNLGMFDIDAFTPIINLPQCAILGVGRIVPKQVVIEVDSQHVAIRHMMFLSLTFDHRVVDGAPAARFLQRIKQLVENPYLWLVS